MLLTTHPLLVPWSWKGRAIPLLPLWVVQPVQSLSACTRVHFTFLYRIKGRNILQVTRVISYIAYTYCTKLGTFLHKKVTEYPWYCAVINLHWLWMYHLYEDNSTNQACLTLLTVSWALSIGFCCCCTLSLAWPSCTVQHLLAACDGWVRLLDKAGYPCWPCNSTTKQHGSTVSRHQTHLRKLSEVNLHFYFLAFQNFLGTSGCLTLKADSRPQDGYICSN